MIVHQITTIDEGQTNPKRSAFGITLALRWGDVLHPRGPGLNADGQSLWFHPPYFERALRLTLPMAVPVLACCVWMIGLVLLAVRVEAWALLALPSFLLIPGAWASWNLWGWRGYAGWKIYGVDSDAYKLWPALAHEAHEVYPGSLAMQFSARLGISD